MSLGKGTTSAPSGPTGVMATARRHQEKHGTREAPAAAARDRQPEAREGQAGPSGVAERFVVPLKPGNAGGGKGPPFKGNVEVAESRWIDMRLAPTLKVRKLQEALQTKAKSAPSYRFYALYDKLFRADVLEHALARCRANGGAPGVDGQTFADIEAYGKEKWLGELAGGWHTQ